MIIGIDPGLTGSIVMLTDKGSYISHLSMPSMKVGSKGRVNGAAVAAYLRESLCFDSPPRAYLEAVGAFPGQGTASCFSFGHSAGLVEGLVQGLGIEYQLVTPQAWKKAAGLIGQDKDAARSRAIQIYPALRVLDLKGKGQAVADALLIARYGARLELS